MQEKWPMKRDLLLIVFSAVTIVLIFLFGLWPE
jgi:hypothetical protein